LSANSRYPLPAAAAPPQRAAHNSEDNSRGFTAIKIKMTSWMPRKVRALKADLRRAGFTSDYQAWQGQPFGLATSPRPSK